MSKWLEKPFHQNLRDREGHFAISPPYPRQASSKISYSKIMLGWFIHFVYKLSIYVSSGNLSY